MNFIIYLYAIIITIISIYLSKVYGAIDEYIRKKIYRIYGESNRDFQYNYNIIIFLTYIEIIILILTIYINSYAYIAKDIYALELAIKLIIIELTILALHTIIVGKKLSGAIICSILPILTSIYYYIYSIHSYILSIFLIPIVYTSIILLWTSFHWFNPYNLYIPIIGDINIIYLQKYTVLYITTVIYVNIISLYIDIIKVVVPLISIPFIWIATSFLSNFLSISLSITNIYGSFIKFLSIALLLGRKMHIPIVNSGIGLYIKSVINRFLIFLKVDISRIEEKINKFALNISKLLNRYIDVNGIEAKVGDKAAMGIYNILASIIKINIRIEQVLLKLIRYRILHYINSIQRSFEHSLIALSLILGFLMLIAIIIYIFITSPPF